MIIIHVLTATMKQPTIPYSAGKKMNSILKQYFAVPAKMKCQFINI